MTNSAAISTSSTWVPPWATPTKQEHMFQARMEAWKCVERWRYPRCAKKYFQSGNRNLVHGVWLSARDEMRFCYGRKELYARYHAAKASYYAATGGNESPAELAGAAAFERKLSDNNNPFLNQNGMWIMETFFDDPGLVKIRNWVRDNPE